MNILKIVIAIFVLCTLYSCNNNTNKNTTSRPSTNPYPTVESTTIHTPHPSPTTASTSVPKPTPTQTPKKNKSLSSFSTPLLDKEENRLTNIKLAAECINGYVLKKNAQFSFNEIVGERSAEKGYKDAGILVGTEHTNGLGGGVCQVSSTIYNAAVKCGMKITEHHTHKTETAYAPNGTDATVNYNNLDMKFVNTLGFDIKINIVVSDNDVSVSFVKL